MGITSTHTMKLATLAIALFISAAAAGPIQDATNAAKNLFNAVDTNGDGICDASEIAAAVGVLGISVTPKQVGDIIGTIIEGKDSISLSDLGALQTAAVQAYVTLNT